MPANTAERAALVAPCGIDCGICELHTCRNNQQLREQLVSRGIPAARLPCPGCREAKGDCPVISGTCETSACASQHKVGFCFECSDFPCARLNPAADRADVLPHNTKVFNLCTIERDGVAGFLQRSAEIKQKYFKGKVAVGKGPAVSR